MALVMSHSAGFLLPSLGTRGEAVTIVREPLDRVLSRYFFTKSRRPPEGSQSSASSAPRAGTLAFAQEIADLYHTASASSPADPAGQQTLRTFFNGQARLLLEPWYDTAELGYAPEPPPEADLWRERLFEDVLPRYTVGVQERPAPFVDALADRLGLGSADLPRKKANPSRPSLSDVPAATLELIRAHNWLDAELHRTCAERFGAPTVAQT
jgi:hypothetical protein